MEAKHKQDNELEIKTNESEIININWKPENVFTINFSALEQVIDKNSMSGSCDVLRKGKLQKDYSKKGKALHPEKTRESKTEYYVKPLISTSDNKLTIEAAKLAVLTSRQIKHAVSISNSEDYRKINIGKQRLFQDGFNSYLMVSQDTNPSKDKTKHNNNQFSYLLGTMAICCESDFNLNNFQSDKDGNLIAFDIGGPSSFFGDRYIGCYLFWDHLMDLIDDQGLVSQNISTKFALSQALKKGYFFERYLGMKQSKQDGIMSYESIEDFIKKNIEYCDDIYTKNRKNESFISNVNSFISTSFPKTNDKDVNNFIKKANDKLQKAKPGSKIYNTLEIFIDGAVDFYYYSPSAKIEKKHILATSEEDLNKDIATLSKIHDKTFNHFCALIKSFNNQPLKEYLDKKIEKLEEENGIVDTTKYEEGKILEVKNIKTQKSFVNNNNAINQRVIPVAQLNSNIVVKNKLMPCVIPAQLNSNIVVKNKLMHLKPKAKANRKNILEVKNVVINTKKKETVPHSILKNNKKATLLKKPKTHMLHG